MNYVTTVKTAIITFPMIAFLFTIPFILSQYHKYGAIHKGRVLIIYSFILYLITAYFMVILPLPSIEKVRALTTPTMNLVPFDFVRDFMEKTSLVITMPSTYLTALKESCFYVPVFNLFLTMPFGMYLRYYYKCSFKKTILYSFLLSLFFELTQLSGLYFIYPRPYRLFDVDDLLLNTLGGAMGYFIVGWFRFLPSRDAIDARSYEEGLIVSPLRRITLFLLDIFLLSFLTIFVGLLFDIPFLFWILFFLYYVLIPFWGNGKTLGGRFLHVRMVFVNHDFLRLCFRAIFLYLYYFKLPMGIFMLPAFLQTVIPFSNGAIHFFLLILTGGVFLFYVLQPFLLFKKKRMFYENFLGIRFQSTILEKKRR